MVCVTVAFPWEDSEMQLLIKLSASRTLTRHIRLPNALISVNEK